MAEFTVEYPDDLLVTSGKPRSEVERELKFQLAVRLFEVGQLSLGKAAELAGWNRLRFADELGRMKVPVVNLDNEEIQADCVSSEEIIKADSSPLIGRQALIVAALKEAGE